MKHLFAVLLCVLLGACSSLSSQPEISPRPQRELIKQFNLEGRIAISQAGRANSLRVNWDHRPDSDLIGFSSPLGNQLAQLQRDAQGARWLSADGDRQEARSADELLARLTQRPIPVDHLILWMLGRVGQSATQQKYDTQGRLLQALDQGWTIRILSYENTHPNALPSTLEAEAEGLRLKLAIEAWQL